MIQGTPLPATDNPLDREFWERARQGQLVVQSCGHCGEMRFPPRPMCPHCQSEQVVWQEDVGEAVIWSFASPRAPLLPAFELLMPYVVIIGALKSHPAIRIAGMAVWNDEGDVTGLTADQVEIGQPIHMQFKAVSDDCTLAFWRIDQRPVPA